MHGESGESASDQDKEVQVEAILFMRHGCLGKYTIGGYTYEAGEVHPRGQQVQ